MIREVTSTGNDYSMISGFNGIFVSRAKHFTGGHATHGGAGRSLPFCPRPAAKETVHGKT